MSTTFRRLKELIVECDINTTMSLNIDPNAKEVSSILCVHNKLVLTSNDV